MIDKSRIFLETEPKDCPCKFPRAVRVVFPHSVMDICKNCHWELEMIGDPAEDSSKSGPLWRHIRPIPPIIVM
jgi:hypothetical protein